MIVDDNRANRLILEEMLTNWGMHPSVYDNAASALEAMESNRDTPFGLLVTDVNMPDMSGYEMLQSAEQASLLANTPTIVLTSSGRQGDLKLCRELGVASRLMKPVKQSELFDAIVMALGVNAAQSPPPRPETDVAPLAPMRILLVEDNLVNQKLAANLLALDGHHHTVASDGQQAVDIVTSGESFDVILMDVQMPRLDGHEATQAIRDWEREQHCSAHTIIAMTAHAMKGDRQKCLDSGMDDYLAKPIRINLLRQKLRDLSQSAALPDSDASRRDPPSITLAAEPIISLDEYFHLGLSNVSGDHQMYADLLQLYVREAKQIRRHLEQAVEQGDYTACPRLLHTLKGASMSVGLKPMILACKAGEEIPVEQDAALHAAIDEIQSVLHQTLGRIEQWQTHHASAS